MSTMMSKVFQSKLAKIFEYPMKKNSETIKQHIFLTEHGAHFASKVVDEIDSIFAWIIVPTHSMIISPA